MQREQLTAMRMFFEAGETRTWAFRRRQLEAFRQAVVAREKAILQALYADLKKSPEETWVTETGLLLQEINYTIKHLRLWMLPRRTATNLINLPSSSYIYPSPLGIVLIIGPWNFPLQLLLVPLVGAIAAGNCAVIKPSEFAPATAALVEELVTATFPKELVQVVQGDGATVVPALMNDFRFDHIFYTGSIPVGKAIYQAAAKDLVPVTLELGGKAPCVVEKDANLKTAARRITVAKFSNAGQMCVSPDYLLVHREVKDQLLALIKENIRQFYGADPANDDGYGKIINAKRFDRLVGYLQQGKILYGGGHDKERLCLEPTILGDVPFDAPVMQEEIFGPILPVYSFDTREEAMALIRRNPNPLSFYLFTSSRAAEKEWLAEVQFGSGCINNAAWQFTNHHLPFGGVAQSGTGAYHGRYSFEVFTHMKAIMKTPAWFDPAIKYPPYKGRLGLFKKFIGR